MDRRVMVLITVLIVFSIISESIGESIGAGVVVSPTRFEIKQAGTFNGVLTVSNPYSSTIQVKITPKRILKDRMNLLLLDDGVARWIVVENSSFTLRPGERRSVNFRVIVPSNYDYRDAVGALVVTSNPPEGKRRGEGTSVILIPVTEVIVPVVIGLPGEIRESMSIESFSGPGILLSFMPGRFKYSLRNRGNVYENFTSTLTLKGITGGGSVNASGGAYPSDIYRDEIKWTPGLLDMGVYSADLTVDYGRYSPQEPLKVSRTLIVIPAWIIVLLVLLMAIYILRGRGVRLPRIRLKIER